MSLISKLVLRSAALFLIFILPFYIVYSTFKTEPVEVVRSGFGLIPSILLSLVVFVGIGFIFTVLKEKILNDKAGRIAIAFYGFVLLSLFGVTWSILASILNIATNEFESFQQNFELYISVTRNVSVSVFVGIILVLSDLIYQLKGWKALFFIHN